MVRAARTCGRHLRQLLLVELELELVGAVEPGDTCVGCSGGLAAGHRALTCERTDGCARILHELDEVVERRELHAELLRLRDDAGEREQLARILDDRIVRVLRGEEQDRGDQLAVGERGDVRLARAISGERAAEQ